VDLLQQRLRRAVVKTPGAKGPEAAPVPVKDLPPRSVFHLIASVLDSPAIVYIFADMKIRSEPSESRKEVLSRQEIAGGNIEKPVFLLRASEPGTHVER
jgi:hypothetical protein